MGNTDIPPVPRIMRQATSDRFESKFSPSPMNSHNPNQPQPGAGASQSRTIGPSSSRLSWFPTASLPQRNVPITVPVQLRTWHSYQGTLVVVNKLG